MSSSIDPTKPVDGVPAVKVDLRTNLTAAKDEIEALQRAIFAAETVAGTTGYAAGDFDNGPRFIIANPSGGAFTITFPAPVDFGLTATQWQHIAVVVGMSAAADVTIACADPTKLRSQPGVSGWAAATSPVRLGASLAGQDEATVSVGVDGVRGLLVLGGHVRV
ncbi:MAG TPA: hypothetical protein VM487_11625 [Phycisphaerae bacterium]|nr:hypothetical protein [Phycisphaerae bacterium]